MKTRAAQPANVNTNNNTNQVNVKVNVEAKTRKPGNRKSTGSRITKLLIAGIVTALISLGVYYLKTQMGKSGRPAIIEGK